MTGASRPGAIVLFGSGETGAVGGAALRWLRGTERELRSIVVLETPAGFEPNADAVTARWTGALRRRPEARDAKVTQIAARRRDTALSPDDRELVEPVLGADLVVLGAGSPTYAVRQLDGSLAWRHATAAHALGASFFLASAAAVAAGTCALPVYEIYKAGADLGWQDGLGLFERYGLRLAVVTHWDNTDGGTTLDTSRCFMGEARFATLRALLPPDVVVVGIDEHTALAMDPAVGSAQVLGRGDVTVVRDGRTSHAVTGDRIDLSLLGPFEARAEDTGVPAEVARAIRDARAVPEAAGPPADVARLVRSRERARAARDWPTADRLRHEIGERGWVVEDHPSGPRVTSRS